jgi:hypothetical protein
VEKSKKKSTSKGENIINERMIKSISKKTPSSAKDEILSQKNQIL